MADGRHADAAPDTYGLWFVIYGRRVATTEAEGEACAQDLPLRSRKSYRDASRYW